MGSYNLNSDELLVKSVDDNGNCETMIGKKCLDALSNKVYGAWDCGSVKEKLKYIPDECPMLAIGKNSVQNIRKAFLLQ